MPELAGKVVVVTGASSGIGAATAGQCAAAGMRVLAVARRADRLQEVVEGCRARGMAAEGLAVDVAQPGATEAILTAARSSLGEPDVIVANAGYGTRSSLVSMSEAELRAMFEVNFFAAVSLCRSAAHAWIAQSRPGHLIMSSSCVAKFPLAFHGAYCATKASQAMVCGAMRAELEHHGIAVSSVHPVTTRTEFFMESDRRSGLPVAAQVPDHAPRWMVQSPERVAAAVVRCMRRPTPEVWTSSLVRLSAGLFTAFPSLLHLMLDRQRQLEEPGQPGA